MRLSKALFHLTALAATVFVITIFAMVVATLGEPNSPSDKWFAAYGAIVMTVEVVSIGVFGFLAMLIDRSETLREAAQSTEVAEKTSESE